MKNNRAKSPLPKPTKDKNASKNTQKVFTSNDDLDTSNFKEVMKSGKANILVVVRCRPLSKKETEVSDIETVKILNNKIAIVLDPVEYNGHEEVFKNRSREQQYAFDYAFDKSSTQQDVYENSTKFLLPGIIQGFNATVFAYGATGAGKTHTMLGTGKDPGIMARSLAELFTLIESNSNRDFRIRLYYVEIYNETLRDLLGNGENLEMREDPSKGSVIIGINEIDVNSSTEVFELLLKGNKNRTTEATNMNETSSRSHAILQITIEHKNNNQVPNSNNEIVAGKFILVDLAGSERAASSANTGMRLVEGGNINKSLLALGNCINALVEISNGSSRSFIPWRDSKLTRILKDSLGGNSRIVMIANISPSIFVLEDTLNTLKYANRAKNIKTNIKRNVLDVDYHISKYDEVISNLKSELENLRHQLAVKTHNAHILKSSDLEKQNPINKIEKANKEITSHFQEEIRIRKDTIDEEKKIENLLTDLKEKEYELYRQLNMGINSKERGSGLKQKELKNSINKINEQIEFHKNSLNTKLASQNELIRKREDLQLLINKYSSDPLDHRKNLNLSNLRQKEVKLNKLIDQIKIRDDLISNAKNELNKKGLKVKQNEGIQSLETLNIEHSFVLPVMIVSPNNENHIQKPNSVQYQSHKNMNNLPVITSKNNLNVPRSRSPYEAYNNPNIFKEKKKFKSKTTEIIEKVKKNELSELKLNLINDLYPNSKVYYLNSNKPNRRLSQQKLKNVIAFDTKNLGHKPDKVNTSMNSNKNSDTSFRSVSRREREIDRKVKNIMMRKNIVGRHRNSPYIQKFNK